MNWASVCAGSAGIAALVLVEDRPRLARMIVRVLRALEAFLSGFASDGGTPEGIAYWEYGFGFYTYFAEALREYTGGAIDLLVGPQIQRIAVFPNAVALGEDHFVNFSDANPTARMHAGLCAHLAERTGVVMPPLPQPDFATDHIFRWAHISRDLLWSKPSGTAPLADGSFFLRDLAWVIDRRTVDGKMLAFAAKGGHNDEPHNHNDLGHFILHVGGESLLADVGAGRYTRQYFGAERYESIHSGAQGHSVPGIGGMLQQAGREYEAHTLTYGTRSDGVDFALDLTDAYALPALRHFARHFDWRVDPQHHSATLTLTDVLEAVEPVTLDERLVSFQAPVLCTSGDEGAVIWRGAQGEVTLHYDARQFSAEIAPATTSDHFGAPLAIYVLLLHANNPLPQQRVVLQFTCQLQ